MQSNFNQENASADRVAPSNRSDARAEPHTHPLVEAMICQLHSTALHTAAVASVINAAEAQRSGCRPSELLALVPGGTAIQFPKTRTMLDSGLSPLVLLAIHDFVAELEPARAVLQRYAVDATVLSLERALALHRLLLKDAWRRLSQLALEAVDQVDRDLSAWLPACYADSARLLRDLLLATEAGASPCLDAEGHLAIPALPQRRRASRRTLLQNCSLTYRNKTYRAFVQNISSGGLGLARAPALIRGEPVVIELRSGRRLAGTVVWSTGANAGVRFMAPLSQRDPMLGG